MDSPSFARFQAEVLCLNEPPIRAKGTYRQLRQVLRELAALTVRDEVSGEIRPLLLTADDIKPTAIAAWIKSCPRRTPVRAASLLRSLSSACTYGKEQGYMSSSPFSYRRVNQWVRVQVLTPDRPRVQRHQSEEAIRRFLDLLDYEAASGSWKAGRLQALGFLLANLGVRKDEALNLRPWDIDLGARTLTIEPRLTFRPKTLKSAAKLPINDDLARVLSLWLPRCGGNWVFPGVRLTSAWRGGPPGYKPLDEIRSAGERAGIKGLTIASFRKTIGTLAKSWGLGQLELKALLRHSNVETQRWYDEEAVESLRPAVAKIQFRVVSVGA
jgi:integrase